MRGMLVAACAAGVLLAAGIAIRFTSQTFLTPTPTDYGFKAIITTPADSYVDITRTVFDRMAIYFYAVVRDQDTPPDMPWSMTVSSDPIAPPPGAVPEPATWAMMILGFGLTGAALRRRPPSAGRA